MALIIIVVAHVANIFQPSQIQPLGCPVYTITYIVPLGYFCSKRLSPIATPLLDDAAGFKLQVLSDPALCDSFFSSTVSSFLSVSLLATAFRSWCLHYCMH
jgi:hypothetical protein